jgi:predicted metalloprotease with PDZ domain
MKTISRSFLPWNQFAGAAFVLLLIFQSFTISGVPKNASSGTIEFTVSMENPNYHYFHVSLVYSGIKEKSVELKLPAWTPGYYMIMDYAKNVINFKAEDGSGKSLEWEKTAKNRWKINTPKTNTVKVSYDVYAFRTSVADSFLDDGRGFISPTGIFVHPAGEKSHAVTVAIVPYKNFPRVSTGLDRVPGKENTFYAPDYDVLYDCPILCGNQEILTFETGGIPYTIAAENLGSINRKELTDDYRKIVETATSIFGEVPYKNYTFLTMNKGMGGLEHTNSMAVFSNRLDFNSPEVSNGWLSFIAHEFFHLYNVKTIRPVALGPFDYDEENYTNMLWFSEGVTSYYENLILNRAGFFNRNDVFREMQATVSNYENIPGHLFQSVAQSSFDCWMYFLNRSENSLNTTISYYDKGCALGMLLDLKIRHESANTRSLDDVMRTLYRDFYKGKGRGFTDKEFRDVCEKTAGASLSEFFDLYIPTVHDIDYPKYLGYAGLSIDTSYTAQPGAWLGAKTSEEEGNLMVTGVEWNSPAYKSGLSARDQIREINGEKASASLLSNTLSSINPGDKITLTVSHRDITDKIEIVAGKNLTRSFEIKLMPDPTTEQTAILDKWLK